MKRLIFVLMMCAVCAVSPCQQTWDTLGVAFSLDKAVYDESEGEAVIPRKVYSTRYLYNAYDGTVDTLRYRDGYIYERRYIPKPIYDEYKMGSVCMTAAKATIGIGVPVAVIGGIMAGVGKGYTKTAGWVFVGTGCALVSVSIPLFSWGDHMKREANWAWSLFEY